MFTENGGSFENKHFFSYSKTCVKWPLSKRPKIGFHDKLSLNTGQKYCRMLQGEHSAIYFGPSLSYHFSVRSLFCLILKGHFTQVLLCLDNLRWEVVHAY